MTRILLGLTLAGWLLAVIAGYGLHRTLGAAREQARKLETLTEERNAAASYPGGDAADRLRDGRF